MAHNAGLSFNFGTDCLSAPLTFYPPPIDSFEKQSDVALAHMRFGSRREAKLPETSTRLLPPTTNCQKEATNFQKLSLPLIPNSPLASSRALLHVYPIEPFVPHLAISISPLHLLCGRNLMVSLSDSQMPTSPTPISSLINMHRSPVHSMRTIRSNVFQNGGDDSSPDRPSIGIRCAAVTESFTDSGVDFRLQELVAEYMSAAEKPSSPDDSTDLLELSRDLSDFSSFSSDISGELRRLASVCGWEGSPRVRNDAYRDEIGEDGSELGFIEALSAEILQNASLETAEGVLRSCVETLSSSDPTEKRAAAGKIRLLAKNRSDFRELIGASGAIQSLIPLLRCTDPAAQENAVTALLNLSLEESNRTRITATGAIKPLVYALRTGTVTAKQNAACALLNLSMNEDNQITIGICGAIPPLVSLLMNGSSRGKKDALTTLYKLCGARQNKERAVSAGAVTPLVALVAEGGGGTAEKAMVVLNSLSSIEEGRKAIVDEGGIPALVESVESGPVRGKDFAVLTLLQLCSDSERNRELLVREGAIPPLVALSQSPTTRVKHKVATLLKYLREATQHK